MSELIVNADNRPTIRRKLLTGASALALAGYISSASMAYASEDGRPVIWLEADGQFALQSVDRESFLPPFVYASQFDGAVSTATKTAPSVWDESAKLSFQPSNSDWITTLGIRYGKTARHETSYQGLPYVYGSAIVSGYQDSHANTGEKHLILDFQAGKDFGLGRLGPDGGSLISIGVRYAQFNSRDNSSVVSKPIYAMSNYNKFYDSFEAKRSFRGVGPSLSWDGTANLAGNLEDGSLALDWGLNGSLLFGRQKVDGHHQKTDLYQPGKGRKRNPAHKVLVYQTSTSPARSKDVTAPNLGAYAALSVHYTSLKVSLGYRADMFFNVIDGGIDAVKKENRSFYGPYASISIGIGD